jgi:hypothetical protein
MNNHYEEKPLVDKVITWSGMLWRSFIFFALLLLLLYIGLHWPG